MSRLKKSILAGIIILCAAALLVPSKEKEEAKQPTKEVASKAEDVQPPKQQKQLAYSYAMDLIKQRLNDPGSASFPGISERFEHVRYHGNGVYEIKSWVGASNALGATVKKSFTVVLKMEEKEVIPLEVKIE
jgi:hypothetical protein